MVTILAIILLAIGVVLVLNVIPMGPAEAGDEPGREHGHDEEFRIGYIGMDPGQYLLSWVPIQRLPYGRKSQFYDVNFRRSTLSCQRIAPLHKRLSTRK